MYALPVELAGAVLLCRESVLSSALESLENEGAPIELAQARGKLALISNPRRDVLRTSAHVPPSRGCRPHAVYAASNLVEAIEVEVARRIRQFGSELLLEHLPRGLDLQVIRRDVVTVIPKLLHALVRFTVELPEPDLFS